MALEESKREDDTLVEAGDLRFIIDKDAMRYLSGATVDYRESFLGGGFTIKGPGTSHC
ncbi:MAG: hypothetical protein H0Z39_01120 [Peptococcaceae bacterium]|nr:hypothetical protein [Peptococcaceae bacterium]